MKIIICGLPRTGKTTFCKLLAKELKDFNLYVTEAIRNAFQKIEPDAYWGNKNSDKRKIVFPEFVKEFLDWNQLFCSRNSILDCALIETCDILKIKNQEDKVVCFGFGGKSNEEIFKIIRRYEKKEDYTSSKTDELLLSIWGNISEIDKENIEFCKKNNIQYFDTSDREEMKNIKTIILKSIEE